MRIKNYKSCSKAGEYYEGREGDLQSALKYFEISCQAKILEDCERANRIKSKLSANSLSQKKEESSNSCLDPFKLKHEFQDEKQFWQSEKNKDYLAFFNLKSELQGCINGKKISLKLAEKYSEDLVVFIEKGFTDFFNNKTYRFIIFEGQCVEGPCQGNYNVYVINGSTIKRENSFKGVSVNFIENKNSLLVKITDSCYNYSWGTQFEWATFFKLTADGKSTFLPYKQIKIDFPNEIEKLIKKNKEFRSYLKAEITDLRKKKKLNEDEKRRLQELKIGDKLGSIKNLIFDGKPIDEIRIKIDNLEIDGYNCETQTILDSIY